MPTIFKATLRTQQEVIRAESGVGKYRTLWRTLSKILAKIFLPVFRIRIRMDPHSIGRPDPGGLKRAKMKKKRSKKPDN
jgi:hypothetical protein